MTGIAIVAAALFAARPLAAQGLPPVTTPSSFAPPTAPMTSPSAFAPATAPGTFGPPTVHETLPRGGDVIFPTDRRGVYDEVPLATVFRDPFETDRDSFIPSARTVAAGRSLLESSYTFLDNRDEADTHSGPEMLVRLGVHECFELRFGWNYQAGGRGNDVTGYTGFGELGEFVGPDVSQDHRFSYGFKVGITDEEDLIPQSAFILQGVTPTGGNANATHLQLGYVASWELPCDWLFDAAARYNTASDGNDRYEVFSPSAVLRVPLSECLNVQGEYFGLFATHRAGDFSRHYVSPGVNYLLSEDVEFGVRVGWGLNDQSARFFTNTGIGVRY
jgi:hypothetical protein